VTVVGRHLCGLARVTLMASVLGGREGFVCSQQSAAVTTCVLLKVKVSGWVRNLTGCIT